ncbi:MAG: hypothetical protein IPK65_08630 [Gammaproteobacteria bacterium]|nr:hypothetical protein [Gammaproteobacteria bacterium]
MLRLCRWLNEIQLFAEELTEICDVVVRMRPIRMLVFGVGNDSTFWRQLNERGSTVFLEDNAQWMSTVLARDPLADVRLVSYHTQIEESQRLMERPELLQLDLPQDVRGLRWDVVIVDAPAGWQSGQPGRMKSIFEASRLVCNGGHVFVHDCDREVEKAYCDRYLRPDRLTREVQRMRHYVL